LEVVKWKRFSNSRWVRASQSDAPVEKEPRITTKRRLCARRAHGHFELLATLTRREVACTNDEVRAVKLHVLGSPGAFELVQRFTRTASSREPHSTCVVRGEGLREHHIPDSHPKRHTIRILFGMNDFDEPTQMNVCKFIV
jgi:hypothetical protein